MQSHFAFTAFLATGLTAGIAMSCAVAMWNMINQIKTVPIRTGQNRRTR